MADCREGRRSLEPDVALASHVTRRSGVTPEAARRSPRHRQFLSGLFASRCVFIFLPRMSVSRKNWSQLSSLARQRTMEDEEEVQRERRRRVKSSTGAADPEVDVGPSAVDKPGGGGGGGGSGDASLSSEEQMQVDFVEMLRVRDEKRRMRHVEAVRRQKTEEEEEEEEEPGRRGGGAGAAVREDDVFTRQPARRTSSLKTTVGVGSRNPEHGASSGGRPGAGPPSRQDRQFVSSVSISLDRSPPLSVSSPPLSPGSPREPGPPPCRSRSGGGAPSWVQNGEQTLVNGGRELDRTEKPAVTRHTSRTVSFKMVKKKEEDGSPMRRSSSMRIASKKFEAATEQTEDGDKTLPFQRNSKQRASSRSIQEKMERLAQAAQKSDVTRPADVSQRTLLLLEEVRRKRGLFEKEPQTEGATRQEPRGSSSGVSGRVDRWLNRARQATSSHGPADLRHVDISSKKSLFENRGERSSGKL